MKNSLLLLFSLIWSVSIPSALAGGVEPPSEPSSPRKLHRFVLAIGSNHGGKERETLLYAGSDARSFSQVLIEMGGVDAEDVSLLENPTPRQLDEALEGIQSRLARSASDRTRTEMVLYYSGHADYRGLLLGDSRLDYRTLRRKIGALSADVRIAVLDACASGAITRVKGGKKRPPFAVDGSVSMRGYAFLTSSSPEEVSQESDRIRSSFFTHSLISGLRGAADASGDGKVTLNEAYHFAFNETLLRTERTKGGPQHPAYDINLSGSGDFVMTDLRSTRAGMVFDKELEGRIFIRDGKGHLVSEISKSRGQVLEIGLPAGPYRIFREHAGSSSSCSVQLEEGAPSSFSTRNFTPLSKTPTLFRGESGLPEEAADSKNAVRAEIRDQVDIETPLKENFTFSIGYLLNHQPRPFHGLQLSVFLNNASSRVEGGQVALLGNRTGGSLRGAQVSAFANLGGGDMHGAQASWFLNTARDVKGLQAACFVNTARNVKGVQIGLVNISRDIRGIPLGFVNYSHTGLHNLSLWTDELGIQYATVMSGSRHFHTFASLGSELGQADPQRVMAFGFGAQTSLRAGYAGADLGAYTLFPDRFSFDFGPGYDPVTWGHKLFRLRFLGGHPLLPTVLPALSLFGGISLNIVKDSEPYEPVRPRGGYRVEMGEDRFFWPGFFLGIRAGR